MVSSTGRSRQHPLRLLALLVAWCVLPLAAPVHAAESNIANVQFEATIPAPVVAFAASSDGHHLLAVDEEARFTFIPDAGGEPAEWRAPRSGLLGQVDPTVAEIEPVPIGGGVSPDGRHWAASVAYEKSAPGRLYGFARWSDEPIWTYSLPTPSSPTGTADQPTVLASGGPYHALGTQTGKVYIVKAQDEGNGAKTAYRIYHQDNEGNAFSAIQDIALSRNGKYILIGTDGGGVSSLHLFSDIFFQATFRRVTQPIEHVAMSPDGTRGAAVTGTGANTRLHFLDLQTGTTVWETTIGDTVHDLALSGDGSTLVIGTDGGRLAIFQETGGPADRDPVAEHALSGPVRGVAIADAGDAIAAATDSGRLHFLDAARPAPLWEHNAGTPLVGVALSADAEALAFAARSDASGRVVYSTAQHSVAHVAPPQPRLLPGQNNTIGVVTGNSGNRMETVHVDWKSLPSGWYGSPLNRTLAPGEQATLNVRLDVPKGQSAGPYAVAFDLVTAHQRIPVRLDGLVPQITSGRTTMLWQIDAAVPDGAPAAFLLKLENTGNTPNDVAIGYARLPAGWRGEFSSATEIDLRVGEDRSVVLKVWAPRDASVGRDATFDLVMAWKSGEERLPLAVRVLDARTYYDRLAMQIDGGGIGDAEPLAKSLQQESLDDIETASTAPRENKGSPGVAFLVPVVVLVGAVALLRRKR